jgi:3-hydroxymyristoyl/3-hydroxydecanoyl-(acyl carrier protein) dehydratase
MESALPVAADHPAFRGHFPGRPILPGVVIVAEALAAIARDTGRAAHDWSIASAKFLRPVAPGTPLTLSHAPEGDGLRFEVRAPDGVVASGTLRPRA